MSSNAQIPLKVPRIILLTLTWAAGVIGGSVGINAIVKRNIQVAYVVNAAAAIGVTAHVDTRSLVDPGILLATGCTLTSLLASNWLALIFLDMIRKSALSTRALTLEWTSMAFMTIWLIACNIPVTYIARTGSAIVTAFLDGEQLPDSAVQQQSAALGVNPAYWSNEFVHLQTMPPWAALLFAFLTAIVSFIASRKASRISQHPHSGFADSAGTIDKAGIAEKETV